mgnify:CR=1 FL=1
MGCSSSKFREDDYMSKIPVPSAPRVPRQNQMFVQDYPVDSPRFDSPSNI